MIGAPSATKGGTLVASDVMVILGIIMAVVAVLAIGIYLGFRVKRRRSEERDRRHAEGRQASDSDEDTGRSGRRRVRRRRRDHRPRNPTLAEAGGLPPQRAENEAPPIGPRSAG